jgi:CTP synthase (UTP-ammonia lyase)
LRRLGASETALTMRIALIGDYSSSKVAHCAIPVALEMEAEARGLKISYEWLHTASLVPTEIPDRFDAGWAVPGSPYESFENVLASIRVLREQDLPFLGTCAGFQHALIEYAQHVLGHSEAGTTEVDPDCKLPVVSKLSCGLVDETDVVVPEPDGIYSQWCGPAERLETYRCSFGPNPDFEHLFAGSAFLVEARDRQGEVRAMALDGHLFFVGTAFQPERAAWNGERHPIISAFISAAACIASETKHHGSGRVPSAGL